MEWTLDRLKHFVAVADAGTMTEAARRLGMHRRTLTRKLDKRRV
jgi:ActR/RegA family two-component response regulator